MKIGELAKATGTQVETVRFYEREGLLPEAARSESNYRVYAQAHAERLGFIRNCRNLDMTLNEIRALLRFRDAPSQNCDDVNSLLDEHIGHVAERIRQLKALEKSLKTLRLQCSEANASKHCGILQGLSDGSKVAPNSTRRSAHVSGSH
jgi:Cd(II)/Pb(II)-responsive transcriptional regulator